MGQLYRKGSKERGCKEMAIFFHFEILDPRLGDFCSASSWLFVSSVEDSVLSHDDEGFFPVLQLDVCFIAFNLYYTRLNFSC
jgi:hypothetical protein